MQKNNVEYKRFIWDLSNVIAGNEMNKKIIFLCIGTNRIVGDSFGPIVGTKLKKKIGNQQNISIIGDIDNALTYNRLEENFKYINKECRNSLIIALDSALSNADDIGKIFIQNRGLSYGESLKKNNSKIGNISIKAVVGEDTKNSIENFKILNNVSADKVQKMCNIVSNGIIEVVNKKVNIGKNIYN